MTTPQPDRPEPVVDEARVASLFLALVLGVVGLVRLIVEAGLGDLSALELAANAVVSAAVALAGYVLPLWRARKARAKVTPLEDPRTADGEQLVPASDLAGYLVDTRTPGEAAHGAPD